MSYNANTAQMICSQHDGIGPINVVDKDWYKKLLKIALCSDAPMKVFSCRAIAKKEDLLTLQASEECKYVPGQSVVVTSTEDTALSGTYVIVSVQLPDKFSIKVPSEISMPSAEVHVSLKTGNWTYRDIDADITDFFPRDYVAGDDYFIRLDNTLFNSLNSNATGRASEFAIMLDLEGTLVQINNDTRMSLPTRFVPSKSFNAVNPNSIKPRNKAWSIFFDHESVYFFSGMKLGILVNTNTANYSSSYFLYDQMSISDELIRDSNTGSSIYNAMSYNMFNMGNLTDIYNQTLYRDGLIAFCFSTVTTSDWYSDTSKLERRVYSAPSLSISTVTTQAVDYIESMASYPEYPNLKSSVLPVLGSSSGFDVLLRLGKFPGTNTINYQINLEFSGGARSGSYPFHEKQIIGKEYYTIKLNKIPLGYLSGRVSITSNISKQLVPEPQPVSGDSTRFSLLGMPIERYSDDSVLIGICRGVGAGLTVDNNNNYTNISGLAAWDGMLIGGVWNAS